MLIEHDIRRPLNATVLDAEVRQRPDGYKEVWIRFTVDADTWAQFEEEVAASGGAGWLFRRFRRTYCRSACAYHGIGGSDCA